MMIYPPNDVEYDSSGVGHETSRLSEGTKMGSFEGGADGVPDLGSWRAGQMASQIGGMSRPVWGIY